MQDDYECVCTAKLHSVPNVGRIAVKVYGVKCLLYRVLNSVSNKMGRENGRPTEQAERDFGRHFKNVC